jgi:type I restriction enzyme S subunit
MAIEFHRDGPWALPEGWVWVALRRLVTPRGEKAPPDKNSPFAFIGMDDVPPNSLRIETRGAFKAMKSAGNKFYPGDVLYGRLRPYLNKVVVADVEGVASGEFIVMRPMEGVEARYLQLWMHARRFVNEATRDTSGDRPRIDFDKIAGLDLALPPIAEQRRIVARIDELFTEIADGETALTRARDDLDTWRRSLLKAAMTGELTREWREHNKPNDTAADLVKRVRAQKVLASNGVRRARRAELADDLDELSFDELPEGWTSARFGELFNLYTGSTPSRSRADYWKGDIPWVSSGEVAFCRITDTAEKITAAGLEASSTRLHPVGTILLAMIGEGKTRGQPAILDIEASNNQNAAAIRVSETSILPEFVFDFLSYRYEKTRRAGQGGNQPALNLGKISQIRMPIPPLAEMREIVHLVDDLRTAMEDVEHAPQMAVTEARKLRQSVLKAAFEGRLVKQDPSDEPAVLPRPNATAAEPIIASSRRARRAPTSATRAEA